MKGEILRILKESDTYISGEELSQRFNVSRTAVWKAIKVLKEQGYNIESVSRKGYKLVGEPDNLSSEELEILMDGSRLSYRFEVLETVDSTNNYAKKLAVEGYDEGTVVLAEEQVSGRGRIGRSWTSPKGEGIWMSLILKPDISPAEASKITLVAAAAMNMAIENSTGIETQIKWPNDIVAGGKKVCGILTELSAEIDYINYVVLGLGVNVNSDNFPEEIAEKATSLRLYSGKSILRKSIVQAFLNEFEVLYEEFLREHHIKSALAVCRSRSATLNKKVMIIERNKQFQAVAKDITDDGHLVVELENGEEIEVVSGEVSVRGVLGYV